MKLVDSKPRSDSSILIVNDNIFQLKLMRFQLEKEGYHVVEAKNGSEALSVLENRKPSPSLIISDIDMPGLNGWELLSIIRSSTEKCVRDIPFLAISAYYNPHEVDSLGRALGATTTLTLPYKLDDFLKTVKKCLKNAGISPKGTIFLDLSDEDFEKWHKILKIKGFNVLSYIEKNDVIDAIFISSHNQKKIDKYKKDFPGAIIVSLRGESFYQDADLIFENYKDIDSFIDELTNVIRKRSRQRAIELLKKRSKDIDFQGINPSYFHNPLGRSLFRIENIGLILLDKNLNPLFISPSTRSLCAEAGKLDTDSLLTFLKNTILKQPLKEGQRTEKIQIGKKGAIKTLELYAEVIKKDGDPNTLIIVKDISDELKELNRLIQCNKVNSLLIMAGGIAHNLNNILMAISGYAQLMQEKIKGEKEAFGCKTLLDNIVSATERAACLVSHMNRFSRPSCNCEKVFDVLPVLTNLSQVVERSYPKLTINISIKKAPLPVKGDPSELENALSNIIINAAKAMNEEGIIDISSGQISIDDLLIKSGALGYIYSGFSPESGLYSFISIKDKGSGISRELLPYIFEPYFTTRIDEGGTGLGLAITYSTIRSFNGFISVETEKGKGSIFTVYLPVPKEKELKDKTQSDVSLKVLRELEGIKCLIVEDEPELKGLMADFLGLKGMDVKTVGDGSKALELLKGGEHFDVIILDLTMPGLDGISFLKEKKALGNKDPVIVATGRVDSNDFLESEKGLQVKAILKKPFNFSSLLKAVDSAIK